MYTTVRTRMIGAALLVMALCPTAAAQEEGAVVIEREGSDQVRAGEMFEYTLQVKNTADYPVQDVVVKQSTGGMLEVRESSPQAQQSAVGQQSMQQRARSSQGQQQAMQQEGQRRGKFTTAYGQAADAEAGRARMRTGEQSQQSAAALQQEPQQWSLGWLAPGEVQQVKVRGIARQEGSLNSCVSVDYARANCAQIDVVQPQLALDLEVLDQQREPRNRFYSCEPIILSHQLKNTGSGETRRVTLKPDVPQSFALAQRSYRVETLSAGETARQEAVVEGGVEPGEYVVQASATTGPLTVHSSQQKITVLDPQLEVSVQAPEREYLGRTVDYVVRVKNPGDVGVADVALLIDRPDNLENVTVGTASTGDGRYDLGVIEPGEVREIHVRGDAIDSGTASLTARVSGYCVEEKTQVARVNLEGIPALVVEVVDNQDPVQIGGNTVYDVNVKNQGTAEDFGVQLSARLPETLRFVEAMGDTQVSAQGSQVNFAPVESLAPGEVASWQIVASAEQAGKGQFELQVNSKASKRPVVENEPTRTY